MEKRVAIVGAGLSGLIACKYAVAKGFNPIVFEEQEGVGGLWAHTIESTKLQNSKQDFCFSDFPWDSSVTTEMNPHNTQVLKYFESYAQHFNLLAHIKFKSRVISIDYVGGTGESVEEMKSWELWGGTGKAFGSKGKWNIKVHHTQENLIKDYIVEFVILCIGRFSGLPNSPEFPQDQGPEVFSGEVLHINKFSELDNANATQLIKGKNVAVVGSEKSALDLAMQCAEANGSEYPCTLVMRTPHWMLASPYIWGVHFTYFFSNRFTELMVHKPGEGFLASSLAYLLSPLRWGMARFAESYLRWKFPMKKYNMIPPHCILQDLTSCKIVIMHPSFYEKVKEGSIIIKHYSRTNLSFWDEGLNIPLKTDLVILATGCKGDLKLKNMFASSTFQDYIFGSPNSTIPLYRHMIHPRIPQLAVIGYAESLNNLHTYEMQCWWLSNFMDRAFEFPSIKVMENDVLEWEKYVNRYARGANRRSCVGGLHIWYNDQLCKDVSCNPKRKNGLFSELFELYGHSDYFQILALKH